jgi:hypothetical protein
MMTAPSKAEFGKVREWLESSGEEIPVEVRGSLEKILAVYMNLSLGATRAKATLTTLRQAMGILPKSERGGQAKQ